MKQNVDLTENEDFKIRQPYFEKSFTMSKTDNIFKTEIDWEADNITDKDITQLLKTGDKNIRAKKKYLASFGVTDENRCDCCGSKIHFNIFNMTICKNCIKNMEINLNGKEIWWRE